MDKHSAGIITFKEIAEILSFYNRNCDYFKNDLVAEEGGKQFKVFIENLTNYFKTLQNTDFNEEQFKEACLK